MNYQALPTVQPTALPPAAQPSSAQQVVGQAALAILAALTAALVCAPPALMAAVPWLAAADSPAGSGQLLIISVAGFPTLLVLKTAVVHTWLHALLTPAPNLRAYGCPPECSAMVQNAAASLICDGVLLLTALLVVVSFADLNTLIQWGSVCAYVVGYFAVFAVAVWDACAIQRSQG